jgi:hypothetical protein
LVIARQLVARYDRNKAKNLMGLTNYVGQAAYLDKTRQISEGVIDGTAGDVCGIGL